jgi:hypothetical protein
MTRKAGRTRHWAWDVVFGYAAILSVPAFCVLLGLIAYLLGAR